MRIRFSLISLRKLLISADCSSSREMQESTSRRLPSNSQPGQWNGNRILKTGSIVYQIEFNKLETESIELEIIFLCHLWTIKMGTNTIPYFYLVIFYGNRAQVIRLLLWWWLIMHSSMFNFQFLFFVERDVQAKIAYLARSR